MQPLLLFRYCPRCGEALANAISNPLRCGKCEFVYFFNPTVAAAAYIQNPLGEYLMIRRANEPAKGLFGIPGGFIDIGESAEEALRREVREEVNLEIAEITYLCSCKNDYLYRDVLYPVCDLIFTAVAQNLEHVQALDAVDAYEWRTLESLHDSEIAFPSIREGRRLLLGRQDQ
jgi:ADP-ribose pyrophosphatase YjhB (NUDIX family)